MPKHIISFGNPKHKRRGIPINYVAGILFTPERERGGGIYFKQTRRADAHEFKKKPRRIEKFLNAWLDIHYPGHTSRFRLERI